MQICKKFSSVEIYNRVAGHLHWAQKLLILWLQGKANYNFQKMEVSFQWWIHSTYVKQYICVTYLAIFPASHFYDKHTTIMLERWEFRFVIRGIFNSLQMMCTFEFWTRKEIIPSNILWNWTSCLLVLCTLVLSLWKYFAGFPKPKCTRHNVCHW